MSSKLDFDIEWMNKITKIYTFVILLPLFFEKLYPRIKKPDSEIQGQKFKTSLLQMTLEIIKLIELNTSTDSTENND